MLQARVTSLPRKMYITHIEIGRSKKNNPIAVSLDLMYNLNDTSSINVEIKPITIEEIIKLINHFNNNEPINVTQQLCIE